MSKCNLTKEQLEDAYKIVKASPHCVRTPLLKSVEKLGFWKCEDDTKVHLKLENMQTSGKTLLVTVQLIICTAFPKLQCYC